MLFDLKKFYKVNTWIKNLGIGIVGILSATLNPNLFYSLLILLQLSLLQMHSFSMNDYFDFKVWKERNYIGELIRKKKIKENIAIFLTLLPLVFLSFILFFLKSPYSFFPALYVFIFFLYQSSFFRFKNHWISYLILTPTGLGIILYLYPHLFFSNSLTDKSIVFSIIFFSYVAFHEMIHMIAHMQKDKIRTLPHVIGRKRTLEFSLIFLIIPSIVAIIVLLFNPLANLIFIGTLFFSILRILKIKSLDINKTNFEEIRNKFYGVHEGIYYITFLLLMG
jgi:4-hydroxybenzoate polyprenyltransferase